MNTLESAADILKIMSQKLAKTENKEMVTEIEEEIKIQDERRQLSASIRKRRRSDQEGQKASQPVIMKRPYIGRVARLK